MEPHRTDHPSWLFFAGVFIALAFMTGFLAPLIIGSLLLLFFVTQ